MELGTKSFHGIIVLSMIPTTQVCFELGCAILALGATKIIQKRYVIANIYWKRNSVRKCCPLIFGMWTGKKITL